MNLEAISKIAIGSLILGGGGGGDLYEGPGVQHLLHLKSKSKILRPIEIMGFFYEFFCQIQGNNLL